MVRPHPDQRILMAAMAVAMRAQVNDLDPMDVDALVVQAGQLLIEGDPLARAITGFATQYMVVRRDPEALAEAGRALLHAVEICAVPVPPDQDRADIHG